MKYKIKMFIFWAGIVPGSVFFAMKVSRELKKLNKPRVIQGEVVYES